MTRYTTPCPECDGDGQVHCYLTVNPSEQPSWRPCTRCDGRGEIDVEPPADDLDELMLWGMGVALLLGIGMILNVIKMPSVLP